ncbi:YciI family protein [Sediminicola luteus]|uniref:YCII-related domain-containing protein n=1 Tax=Sediminicola luteus TaxID=319238 RepID=A0A2A4G6X8_9FLAO|nr:YciI family protein [Sediminicola luteus]PCE64719.1 hypothetical protein B7P33_05980 [Sediminicola luteus]
MKKFSIFLVLIIAFSCKQKEAPTPKEVPAPTPIVDKSAYNAEKAKAFGADEYGMKKYIFAFLKKGPNRDQDSITKAELQRAHLKNINRLAAEGKLVLAGPFFGEENLLGLYIFNVPDLATAEALANSDPAIKAGSLTLELKEWYGSAALMEVNEIHGTLEKKDVASE